MSNLDNLLKKLDERNETYTYHDEYLGIELELKKFSLKKFNQMQEGSDKNVNKALDTMYKVIYEHVPLFQENELFEKSKVQKRENVVPKLYNEKLEPMNKLMKFINNEIYGIFENNEENEKK